MARPVHGLLRPLFVLLAVCCCLLLLQVSECSRPSPSPSSADHDHDDHTLALHHQLLLLDAGAEARTAWPPTSTEVAAGDAPRNGTDDDDDAAPSLAWAATPARPVMASIVASSPPLQASDDRAQPARAGTTKLARRLLAGAGVDEAASATDGATGASCHTYNPHITCPPARKP